MVDVMEFELPVELLDYKQPFRVFAHIGPERWQAFPVLEADVVLWLAENVETGGHGLATIYHPDKPQVIIGAMIHFEDDADAVHFKLRWL